MRHCTACVLVVLILSATCAGEIGASPMQHSADTILQSIAMASADDGWAVGGFSNTSRNYGAVFRWDGSEWRPLCSVEGVPLSLGLAESDLGWVGGVPYTWLRWDGAHWLQLGLGAGNTPVPEIRSFDIPRPNDGWAVGNGGAIIHWDGQDWTEVPSPTDERLLSVATAGPDDGWAVGHAGAMIRWDGSEWHAYSSPTTEDLNSVFVLSSNESWAAGDYGAILHWDGRTWTTVTSPIAEDLNALSMVASDDGWAVGASGTIIRWDGTDWYQFASPTTDDLNAVAMVSAADGWAVGGGSGCPGPGGCLPRDMINWGTLLRWDGFDWHEVQVAEASPGWCPTGYQVKLRITPLPEPTSRATDAPTQLPHPTWTPAPTQSPTPAAPGDPPNPERVCKVVYDRVPAVVINDALASPERFFGWLYPLDPGKPVSPANPLRRSLSLMNVSMPYHPIWNKPVWRVGCP